MERIMESDGKELERIEPLQERMESLPEKAPKTKRILSALQRETVLKNLEKGRQKRALGKNVPQPPSEERIGAPPKPAKVTRQPSSDDDHEELRAISKHIQKKKKPRIIYISESESESEEEIIYKKKPSSRPQYASSRQIPPKQNISNIESARARLFAR